MRSLYNLLLILLLPLFLVIAAVRAKRQTGSWGPVRGRLGLVSVQSGDNVFWVHASSVGEMQAAVPLVKALAAGYPEARLIVTSFTASGMQRARAAFGETVEIAPLPYDLPLFNRLFLERVRPRVLIVMETEVWPNLFRQAAARDIPVLLVSARMTEKSARRYARISRLVHDALAAVRYVGAQSARDGERFRSLGVPRERVTVSGNLKFDIPESAETREQGQALRGLLFAGAQVLVAASTRVGEDEIVLDAFRQVRRRHPDARLVIVPRHPERGAAIVALAREAGFSVAQRSVDEPAALADVHVIDTIGELNAFYAAADACFVGGSLVPVGGHNLLEPASLGIPIVTGTHHFATPDIFREMREAEAIMVARDAASLAHAWNELLDDPVLRDELGQTARAIVERNRGALAAVMRDLQPFLPAA